MATSGPSSASDETVVFRRQKRKFTFQKQLEKSLSGTKLAGTTTTGLLLQKLL